MKLKKFFNPNSKKRQKKAGLNPNQNNNDGIKNKLEKLKNLVKNESAKSGPEKKRRNSVYSLLEEQDLIPASVENGVTEKKKSKKRKAGSSDTSIQLCHKIPRLVESGLGGSEAGEKPVKKRKKKLTLEETALLDSPPVGAKKSKKEKTATNSSDVNISKVSTTELLPSENKDSRDSRTVFIGNLPVSFKKKKVLKLLKTYGEVEKTWLRGAKPLAAKLPKKVAINKSLLPEDHPPLMLYALFKTAADAQKALSLNGEVFNDHRLRVSLSNEKNHDTNKGVFVGNLPFNIKDDDLYGMFQQCGKIVGVRVVRDSQNGVGKGFGYVNFESTDSVELALNLNEAKLNGREIRVSRLFSAGKKKKMDKKKEKQLVKSNSKAPASFVATKNKFKKPKKSDTNEKVHKKKPKQNATELKKKILAEKLSVKPKKKKTRESLI